MRANLSAWEGKKCLQKLKMDSTHSRYFGLGAILATFSPRNYYYQVHELDKTSVTR